MVFGCLSFISLYSVYKLVNSSGEDGPTTTLKGWGNEFFNVLGGKDSSIIVHSPEDPEGWDEKGWEEVHTPQIPIYPSPKPS